MSDITILFKATVRAVKSQIKLQGLETKTTPTNILKRRSHKTKFGLASIELISSITKLRKFLLENAQAYAGTSLFSSAVGNEKQSIDDIDMQAQSLIRASTSMIGFLRSDLRKQRIGDQERMHRHNVIGLIDNYLKSVCVIYSEQKAVLAKRSDESSKHSKLSIQTTLHIDVDDQDHASLKNDNVEKAFSDIFGDVSDASGENDLLVSDAEAQLFEEENKALLDEMTIVMKEVKQIESGVVEITQLQRLFTEKVLQQDTDINHIQDSLVGSTENIKDANEQIRSAMKNDAGFRVWILFFIAVCSLSLLFLDWYND